MQVNGGFKPSVLKRCMTWWPTRASFKSTKPLSMRSVATRPKRAKVYCWAFTSGMTMPLWTWFINFKTSFRKRGWRWYSASEVLSIPTNPPTDGSSTLIWILLNQNNSMFLPLIMPIAPLKWFQPMLVRFIFQTEWPFKRFRPGAIAANSCRIFLSKCNRCWNNTM